MPKVVEDALEKRIARFIADAPAGSSVNSYLWLTVASDVGQVRKENQDRSIAITASYSHASDKNFTLAVLCDGMGGLVQGGEAATLALSVFASRILRTTTMPPAERLRIAAEAANDAVYNIYKGLGGTTLSAVLMSDSLEAYFVNVGDSRVYGISRDCSLVPLTKDDTLGEYLKNPDNLPSGHENRLIQYIGVGEDLEPHVERFLRDEYGSILLTSDGIHGAPASALEQVVRRAKNTKDASRKLLSLAEAVGGRDNATIISIDSLIQQRPPVEQGLTLTFLSAWDRLELWIPRLNEESKSERLPEALKEAGRTVPAEQWLNPKATRSRKRGRSQIRGVSSKSLKNLSSKIRDRKEAKSDSDTDSPMLSIDFPSDSQD